MKKWLIGIDEAGRGPLAGPVAVGVVSVPFDFDWSLIPGVGDSKQIAPDLREEIYGRAYILRKSGLIAWRVSMVSATVIDRKGISHAVKLGINRGLKSLNGNPKQCEVRLDGLLKAPEEYYFQKTIVRGDASEPVIGLASILAKVTRDQYMSRLGQREEFAPYNFPTHKGYGTKKHREIIAKIGLCAIHRRSFCGNLLR